jgi:hypothetical protein
MKEREGERVRERDRETESEVTCATQMTSMVF